MRKIILATIAVTVLAGCNHDKGLRVGTTLKDCAAISANQREEAARSIKGMSRDDATRVLAAKYGVSVEAAGQCLK
jgi:hypothetical protein